MIKPTLVSLFSGAGGLDLGFKQAGFDLLWANDFDADAVATYKHNIGDECVLGDIKNIHSNDIPNADVIIGGFPCQGFSMANTKRNALDERNSLYLEYVRILKDKKPKIFIAENVKGILSLEKGEVLKAIIRDFESVGYQVQYKLLNSADYGVPQTRMRVIIVGIRNDLNINFEFPKPTHSKNPKQDNLLSWVSVKQALEHLPDPDGILANTVPNNEYSQYKVTTRNFTGHRTTNPDLPSPTILARGNGGGGVVAIPHYNGKRRMTVRESACIQSFPDDFEFKGTRGSGYRQVGNAVPVKLANVIAKQVFESLRQG
ncbi:DNA cytosine methyltransferase [Glaesserella parasuis]|nr:DNA cytosine methyltransferase [Glaesserella parasuis]MDP0120459.1 DNA cytosine methyltransferase [Glaesserella parasuis]